MKHPVLALAALLAAAGPAFAQVPPPKPVGCRVAVIADLPVTFENNQPLVQVLVDGHPLTAIIDTGAAVSTIFPEAARRIGLAVAENPRIRMIGVDGEAKSGVAHLKSLGFMGAASPSFNIVVAGRQTSRIEMLIGEDFLSGLDIEFDLGHGRLRLVRTDKCLDGQAVYWSEQYSEARITETFDARLRVPVSLNGKRFSAILDTGAQTSTASDHAAFLADVKLVAAPVGYSTGLAGRVTARRIGVVKSVAIGDEAIANAPLQFSSMNLRSASIFDQVHGASSQDEMLLGADFFRSHHVLLSRKFGKIYFTYNGGPVFRQDPPAAAAPVAMPVAAPKAEAAK